MVLFGLSILIASISLLYFRRLPLTWPRLQWLKLTSNTSDPHAQNEDTASIPQQNEENKLTAKEDIISKKMDDKKLQQSIERDEVLITKNISDSKAMPPPPLPAKKTNLLSTSNTYTNSRSTTSTRNLNTTLFNDREEPQIQKNSTPPNMPLQVQKSSEKPSKFVLKPPMSSLSPLPNRKPDSLAPTAPKSTIPTKSNKKVILKPGHSPLDWARLSSSSANLSGLPHGASYIKVPPSLLKTYTGRKGKDAWTVLGKKVYNITPYLPFHPGGEHELLRSAGKDGTKLFTDVHPWVNWEGMLAACLVGIAVEEHEAHIKSDLHEID